MKNPSHIRLEPGTWLLALVTFLIAGSGSLPAQSEPIIFSHLSIEQGLSQNSVLCIAQDAKGFMWFGTDAGLNRYDGYDFKIYRPDPVKKDSLRDNRISALCNDHQGTLWIGTRNFGLHRYDPELDSFVNYTNDRANPNSLSHNSVTAIHEDGRGRLWIGTEGGGLNVYESIHSRFTRYLHRADDSSTLSDNVVNAIFEDRLGKIWIGTNRGLNVFDDGRFVRFQNEPQNPNSLPQDTVFAITDSEPGVLWVGTDGGGLCRFDTLHKRFTTLRNDPKNPNSPSHDRIRSLYRDSDGKIWIGTWGGGLDLFDPATKRFSVYANNPSDPTSISTNSIFSVFEDRFGVMWIGTMAGGINKFPREKKKFRHFFHDPANPNSLSDSNVFGITEDQDGIVWIGTFAGGLNRFDRKKGLFSAFKHDPNNFNSLPDNRVPSIHAGRDGLLWIGTFNGISCFDYRKNTFTNYRHDPTNGNSLNHNRTTYIYQDREGFVWIGTRGGLDRLDPNTRDFTHYRHDPDDPESLSHDSVYWIFEDRAGFLWVGTEDGLNRFDRKTGKFKVFRHDFNDPKSISSESVYSVYESRSGELWIATTGGLNRMDRSTNAFTAYTVDNGLPDNVIYGILEDRLGRLWFSTNNGLSRFDPKTMQFRNFTVVDGIQSQEFNGNSFYQNSRGEMYFGGINGFNIFYPEEIKDNPFIPPVVFTDFKIMNKSVAVGSRGTGGNVILEKPIGDTDEITLSYRDRLISFEFAALHYLFSEKNLYASKMEGFEPDWNYTDSRRRFRDYTSLPPGRYTFRVKASNCDQVWNDEGIALKVRINPPFWKTWWFMALIGVFVISTTMGIFRWRIRSLTAKKRELEQLVELRTTELKEASLKDPLTGLRNRRYINEILTRDIQALLDAKLNYIRTHKEYRRRDLIDNVFGIFIVDIDHFKFVNDQYGHTAGDNVLIQFATILKNAVRLEDEIIRLGGEEFLVVLKKTDPAYLDVLARKIMERVQAADFILSEDGATRIKRTCSIGCTSFPFYVDSPLQISFEQAIMLADLGLYYAKQNGRNLAVHIGVTENVIPKDELIKSLTSIDHSLAHGYIKLDVL